MLNCHFLIGKFGLGIGYFNRPGLYADYFYSDYGLEYLFLNYTAGLQTPNAQLWTVGHTWSEL